MVSSGDNIDNGFGTEVQIDPLIVRIPTVKKTKTAQLAIFIISEVP